MARALEIMDALIYEQVLAAAIALDKRLLSALSHGEKELEEVNPINGSKILYKIDSIENTDWKEEWNKS